MLNVEIRRKDSDGKPRCERTIFNDVMDVTFMPPEADYVSIHMVTDQRLRRHYRVPSAELFEIRVWWTDVRYALFDRMFLGIKPRAVLVAQGYTEISNLYLLAQIERKFNLEPQTIGAAFRRGRETWVSSARVFSHNCFHDADAYYRMPDLNYKLRNTRGGSV